VPRHNSGKRIGIVDYQLDNFHANTFLKLLRSSLANRGYSVAGATALERERSQLWARERDLPWFNTVDELNDHVDCFMILAPSDPALHFEMCERVFPFGKPTFVDKTFAPDLETARKMFELADRHKIAVQTSSALRYTNVQRHLATLDEPVRHLYVWAGGATFDEYAIHPVELVVSCLGVAATQLMRLGNETHPQLVLRFAGDRTAIIDFTAGFDVPYAVALTTASAPHFLTVESTGLFCAAISAILDFFDAAAPQVDRAESLLVRHILDIAMQPAAQDQFIGFPPPPVPRPHVGTVRRPQQVPAGGETDS